MKQLKLKKMAPNPFEDEFVPDVHLELGSKQKLNRNTNTSRYFLGTQAVHAPSMSILS
jgi:hypothetical protein